MMRIQKVLFCEQFRRKGEHYPQGDGGRIPVCLGCKRELYYVGEISRWQLTPREDIADECHERVP